MIKCFTWIHNRIKSHIFAESGVSTDIWTSYAARIMVISVIPFLVVQIPQLLNSTSGRRLAVLIGLIASLLLLVSYCLYQVSVPIIIFYLLLGNPVYLQKKFIDQICLIIWKFRNFVVLIVLDVVIKPVL